MKNSKTFQVTYTKAVGGNGTILVKSTSDVNAMKCARQMCFTGSDFRDAVETNEEYIKPRKQGFYGSQRAN